MKEDLDNIYKNIYSGATKFSMREDLKNIYTKVSNARNHLLDCDEEENILNMLKEVQEDVLQLNSYIEEL